MKANKSICTYPWSQAVLVLGAWDKHPCRLDAHPAGIPHNRVYT